jgi:hypothetical protein
MTVAVICGIQSGLHLLLYSLMRRAGELLL